MKKIRKLLKNNIKVIIAFVVGVIISGGTVYAATILAANQVGYDNTTSGITSTNVQGALDELYTRANTWIDPSTIQTNATGKIFASSKGIVIRRNGATHFIKANNWAEEQTHIQQVFSDITCSVRSSYVDCNASDFSCYVDSDGLMYCYDGSDYSGCDVDTGGSVNCG